MIRLFVLFFLVLCSAASAQGIAPGPGLPVTAAGGYTGPCEVSGVSCVAFYAAEACMTNAYTGNTVDVVDTATGNTTGTRLQCSSGVVSALVSGSACTFVTGNACSPLATTCATSCTFKTIYEQTGAATFPNLVDPSTLSARMTITPSLLNSKACVTGNGSQYAFNGVAAVTTLAQPMTLAAVSIRTGSFTSNQTIITDRSTVNIGYRTSTNTVGSLGGTVTATATDNVFNSVMEINASGAGNSFMVVNGVAGSTGTLTGAFTAAAPLVGAFATTPTSGLVGSFCEIIVTNNALNSTQYGALNTNQRAANRWGSSF